MKIKILVIFLLSLTTIYSQQKTTQVADSDGIFATIVTTKGNIVIKLDYKKAPITVANFISLSEGKNKFVSPEFKGKHFYDGLKFHRVISNFMIQGGDPSGNGSGGPGYSFKDEISDLKHDKSGTLSMANSGANTNGSQFFITHKDTPWLDGKHTVFGYVTEGQNVVNTIVQDDVITKITIVRKGSEAKKFNAEKVFSNYFNNKASEEKKKAQEQEELSKKIGSIVIEKEKYFAAEKATSTKTASGLAYKTIQKGTGKRPDIGTKVNIQYAGYFENGVLFDSNYEDISKINGKYSQDKASQGGYKPFPFQYGTKENMIPGFLEAINLMSYGDKIIVFIPSNLAYGEKGAGTIIPPNSAIVFEIEMTENTGGKAK